MLPCDRRFAFEFRNDTWWNNETYDLLAEHKAAFCIFELGPQKSPQINTSDFVYIRLHGPGAKYEGKYNTTKLETLKQSMNGWRANGKDVYCYFDNDEKGFAVENAISLNEMLFPEDKILPDIPGNEVSTKV